MLSDREASVRVFMFTRFVAAGSDSRPLTDSQQGEY